ncbi:MAG: hypothetical protein KJO81_09995 [Gammaproteobacteria bacterium]|nr:hypothetical protein [Gammaproteobacteria bacterium]MBT8125144.1 hypothetical protein [Gammaproteobacteria bacterium]MDH3608054.1 hypothetical protein [Gammaproteobacteria bacterium]
MSDDMVVVNELKEEPTQKKIDKSAFSVNVNKVDYEIQPMFDYELYGLVVSYELHDGNYNLHKRWNDHLNIADYCVVWDKSAFTKHLPKINFWNGQFTCNISTKDMQAWESFDPTQLSNNHLISDEKYIRKKLRKIKIGDQIRISGWLSSYKNLNSGGTRGTSITREDEGNGACETIYVKEVSILRHYNSIWRKLMYLSLLVFIVSLVIYVKAPHKARNH